MAFLSTMKLGELSETEFSDYFSVVLDTKLRCGVCKENGI